jgi:arylsulfatase A-like enzyme
MSPCPSARLAGLVVPALAILCGALLTLRCAPAPRLADNVILISIDTLRRDHLGCYGYQRATSPNLDALCREAAVFDQAIGQAPSTLPSHASMLTSLLPNQHGASFANRRALPGEVVTLAEVLKERGFRTAAFTDGGQVAYRWGLHQGFDVWKDNQTSPDTFDRVVRQGLAWLDEPPAPEAPFFLFLHTYEVHHPYTPSAEDLELVGAAPYDGRLGDGVEIRELSRINEGLDVADAEDRAFIEAAYDAEIRSMDRALGRLLGALRERGLLERTLLAFTSDHGEELGEHGSVGWHSHTLFDELLRVPLLLRFPDERWSGATIQRQVRLIDVAPTVLGALGVAPPSEWQGMSLLRLLRGEEPEPLLAVSELDQPGDRTVRSLRTGRWKLYRDQLYDLRLDPEELYDASSGHLDLIEALRARLAQLAAGEGPAAAAPVELSPEAQKRLEALGYL